MTRKLAALLVSGAFVASSGAVLAHHSFAMFDQEHPIELVGTVKEFKFTSPHSFLLLRVKDQDGSFTVWNLEAGSPTALTREGWSAKTLKAGDEVRGSPKSADPETIRRSTDTQHSSIEDSCARPEDRLGRGVPGESDPRSEIVAIDIGLIAGHALHADKGERTVKIEAGGA